jgi:hypothetical protein
MDTKYSESQNRRRWLRRAPHDTHKPKITPKRRNRKEKGFKKTAYQTVIFDRS